MKAHMYITNGLSIVCSALLVACGGGGDSAGAPSLSAGTVSVRWNPPSTDGDGGQLVDLGGYMLYYGRQSGNYDGVIDVGNRTEYDVSVPAGDYYLTVSAYDASGNIGPYSNEIFKTVP